MPAVYCPKPAMSSLKLFPAAYDRPMPLPVNDPFALLGLPRSFEIDPAALQQALLRQSTALHPDRVSDPVQQAEAARQLAAVNQAYAMLQNPEKRANALLAALGGPAPDQDKSLPAEFLPAIMEVREEMELALASHDPAERQRFERWAQNERENSIGRLAELFTSAHKNPSPQRLGEIRKQLNAWRYIERMIEQLDPDYRPVL